MGRKGSFDNNVSFSGFTSRKDKIELQSSVLSTATQSTVDAGASRTKSFSEGTMTRHQIDAEVSTISSDGIPLAHQSSISRVVSLEPALPLNKEIIYPVTGKVEQDHLMDDIQSNCKLTSKHLMSESSSSNSSHVIAPNHSESKDQLELQVDTKPAGVHKAFECSLKKGEFLKGILKQLKSCDEQATSETSQLSEQLCSEKMKPTERVSPETWQESKEAAYEEQQMSNFRVTSDQGPNVCGFDLNETVDESAYHHEANVSEPIVVVAKVGVPNGLPTAPLQFDGELGWRRSLGRSAFRPTFTCKKSVKNTGSYSYGKPTPSLGFDLNVAPPSEPHAVGSSEGNRYHGRPNSQILSFDLNDNLLIDKDSLISCQPKRHYYGPVDSMSGSARQGNVRPAYWVDLSSMPGFTHVQGQPFLVAAPNVALAPGPPPGYYIGTTNGLPSPLYTPNMLPRVGGQHGPLLAAYPGSLHLMEAAQGGGYTPNFYLNAGVGSSENANNRVGNAPAEERGRLSQTVALADKRKEPDGSWGSYQHSHRRMTTWK